MGRWNPITRGLRYDPARVAAACRRRAAERLEAGDTHGANYWSDAAYSVERGTYPVRDAVLELLAPIELGIDDEGEVDRG